MLLRSGDMENDLNDPVRVTTSATKRMNRQLATYQASEPDRKSMRSSQELTTNLTLKDLNIETRRILRKAMLNEKGKTPNSEREVYLSGPCFPSQGYKLKTRLGKTSIDSLATNSAYDGRDKTKEPRQGDELEPGVSDSGESVSKTKAPILCLGGFTGLTEEKSEDKCLERETTNGKRDEIVSSDDSKEHINNLKLSKDEILKKNKNKDCSLLKTGKPDFDNSEINPNSSISRRCSSQANPSPKRLLSSARSSRKNSTNNLKSKRAQNSSDDFSLDHISNPLLRDSLRKILNPQQDVENFDANVEFTREQTTPMRDLQKLFEDEISLPNISARYGNQAIEGNWSHHMDGSFNVKYRRVQKTVRFAGDKPPDLTATKCAGFRVVPSHPTRMLSPCSEYAVKGLIGQWLKRRPGSSVQTERERRSMEKQETYREVQLLKVGLSMRMLAGIV